MINFFTECNYKNIIECGLFLNETNRDEMKAFHQNFIGIKMLIQIFDF
jgi:hypothetical protein